MSNLRIKLSLITFTLMFPILLQAQTGEECYQKATNYRDGKNGVTQNYAEAMKWLKKGAEQGNLNCISGMGIMYRNGYGVKQDLTEAIRLYRQAAEKGLPKAQCNLGEMYQDGIGIEKDLTEAAKWFRKAAEQGHARAQNNLGYALLNGYGVTKNYAEAAQWFRKSAEQGNAIGQSNLGFIYENGRGVEKKYDEALKWYKKSAEQNNAWAQNRIGNMYLNGTGVTKDYAEALKWYRKSAEQNDVIGLSNVGYIYENGYGVTKDLVEAAKWYRKAAELGNAWSQNQLGDLYIDDEGLGKNYEEAFKWYSMAAEQNNRAAITSVGWMYENGHGVGQSYAKALECYRKAADLGNAPAQRNMGIMYEKGYGVDIDYDEAIKWFNKALQTNPKYEKVKKDIARVEEKKNGGSSKEAESEEERLFNKGVDYYIGRNGVKKDYAQALAYFKQAAQKGLAPAQHNVGLFYDKGWGTSRNSVEAVKWFKMAAEQGWDESLFGLGEIYQFGRPGISKNAEEAIKWYLKVINIEDPVLREEKLAAARNNLGSLYQDKKDYPEALKWYRQAAERNSADAQYNLGIMYDQGWGVTVDKIEAAKWFRRAAEKGHDGAQYNLGCMYRDGEGVKQDYVESNKWFLKAAQQGNAEAMNSIGMSYGRGRGGYAQDYQKAIEWYQKSAAKGDANAMNNIGTLYLDGKGVSRDLDKAEEWYRKALKKDPNMKAAKENMAKVNARRGVSTFKVTATYDPNAKPCLEFVQNSIQFIDPSGKGIIRPGGEYKIRCQVKNIGSATAKDCSIRVGIEGAGKGLSMQYPTIGEIKAGATKTVEAVIKAGENVINGEVVFCLELNDFKGIGTGEWYAKASTRGADVPQVQVTDYTLTAESGKVLKKKEPFDLQLMLQNIDLGQAEDVSVEVELPSKVLMLDGEESQTFSKLTGGEAKSLVYSLIVRNDYIDPIIPITVHVKEKTGQYAKDRTISLTLDQSFASAKLSTKNFRDGKGYEMAQSTSDVDKDIPATKQKRLKTFALIIANENYEEVDPVPFAANDGAMFKAYCQRTLGIPDENIHILSDATLGKMRRQVEWLGEVAEAYQDEASIIVYYAGHGIPDEKDKTAYLLPVDGFGRDVKTALSLDELYATLAKLPSKSVTVFLDACFSGAKREGSMLVAARGVAIKPKQNVPEGKLVVFSAAQGDETAHPYDEQQHGMFTYYLLKKLKESGTGLTLGELSDYVRQQVMQQSMKRNGKMQTPTVISSAALSNSWKDMKLK